MVKIPVYQQQVQTKNPEVSQYKPLRPAPGAFGMDVASAVQELGQTGEKVGDAFAKRMIEKVQQDKDKQTIGLDTAASLETQDLMLSQDTLADGTPKGLLNRKLSQTKGITSELDKGFSVIRKKYVDTLKDERQRDVLGRSMDQRYLALRETVIRHERDQGDQDFDNELSSNLKQRISDAAIIQDPNALSKSIDEGVSLQMVGFKHKGMDADTIKLSSETLAGQIAKSSIAPLVETDPEGAQKMLETVKAKLPQDMAVELQTAIDGKRFADKQVATWKDVQAFRFNDGTPDTSKMESYVFGLENYTTEQKEKLWDYVKVKASEDKQQMISLEGQDNKKFMAELYNYKAQGKSYDDAMKLATSNLGMFSNGKAYTIVQRREVIKRLYGTPTNTDPVEYMNLWEGVREGRYAKEDIDKAFNDQKLSVKDWEGLRKEWTISKTTAQKPDETNGWSRIKQLAMANYGNDPAKRAAFLYEMSVAGEGKAPQEVWALANDKLKSDPKTGWWVFGKEKQWQTDLKRHNAQDLAWGKLYQDVGRETVAAIGRGIVSKGNKAWGINDVQRFGETFGGYDKIKPGTDVHKAIQYLSSKIDPETGEPELVTIENVRAVIEHLKKQGKESGNKS